MLMRRFFFAALALSAAVAHAQDYPAKPARVIVPFPPGAILDLITRPVTEKIGTNWGQPVIVEPRPGASGAIGKLGLVIRHSSPEELDSLIHGETERWERIIRERSLKAD